LVEIREWSLGSVEEGARRARVETLLMKERERRVKRMCHPCCVISV
jgi:hypothetical protein